MKTIDPATFGNIIFPLGSNMNKYTTNENSLRLDNSYLFIFGNSMNMFIK